MAGETSNICEMANYTSRHVFEKFRWDMRFPADENFDCVKPLIHKAKINPEKKDEIKHTHPVDVVFCYNDPYLNKDILINTDLKSYKKGSINQTSIRKALKSLANTIECAKVSSEWKARYAHSTGSAFEVRGLLFAYNHDNQYCSDFYNYFYSSEDGGSKRSINTDSLQVKSNQYLHIFDPQLICYLVTVVNDMDFLHARGEFPSTKYAFFYPELTLHRTHGDAYTRAATIEMLSAPYLIIKHEEVIKYNEATDEKEVTCKPGYLIYYNRRGSDYREFMYFFDMLSKMQILDGEKVIKLRIACARPHKELKSSYRRAIEAYIQAWGFDDFKRSVLNSIELEVLTIKTKSYHSTDIGWRV